MGDTYYRGGHVDHGCPESGDRLSAFGLGKRIVESIAVSAFGFTVVAVAYIHYNYQLSKRERERKHKYKRRSWGLD